MMSLHVACWLQQQQLTAKLMHLAAHMAGCCLAEAAVSSLHFSSACYAGTCCV